MANTPQLFEFWDTSITNTFAVYGAGRWSTQTFTPILSHYITSVKLRLWRVAGHSPGTMTVSIQKTTGAAEPDGTNLVSATSDGNTLTTDTTDGGEKREFEFTNGPQLVAGQLYAIVLKVLSGDVNNAVQWSVRPDEGYTVGRSKTTTDSGATWSTNSRGDDHGFEEYGTNLTAGYGWVEGKNLHYIDEFEVEQIVGGFNNLVTYEDTVVVHDGDVVYL